MGTIRSAGDDFLRDYAVAGVPVSGINDPSKASGRAVFAAVDAEVEGLKAAQTAGAVAYALRASLDADLAHTAGAKGEVFADPDTAKNGVYSKSGASGAGAWTRIGDISSVAQAAAVAGKLDADVGSLTAVDLDRLPLHILYKSLDHKVALGVDPVTLETFGILRADALAGTLLGSFVSPQIAYEAGAQGAISMVMREPGAERLVFHSNYGGQFLQARMRTDRLAQAQVPVTGGKAQRFIHLGQSWQSDALPATGLKLLGDGDPSRVFTLATRFYNADPLFDLPAGAIPTPCYEPAVDDIVDLVGVDFSTQVDERGEDGAMHIGYLVGIAMQRIRDRLGLRTPAHLVVCKAYPGATLPQLSPGGSIDGWHPFVAGLAMDAAILPIAAAYGEEVETPAYVVIHGAPNDATGGDYKAAMAAFIGAHDALDYNSGGPVPHAFVVLTPPTATEVKTYNSVLNGQIAWASENASRATVVGGRHHLSLRDYIHNTSYSQLVCAEEIAWAMVCVLDLGLGWDGARITDAVYSGGVFKMLIAPPPVLPKSLLRDVPIYGKTEIDTAFIEAAVQYGVTVRTGGVNKPVTVRVVSPPLPASPFDPIQPDYIEITPSGWVPVSGTAYAVEYLWRGVAQTVNPGTDPLDRSHHSGVWGNVRRRGPKSVLRDGPDEFSDLWVTPYIKSVTVP